MNTEERSAAATPVVPSAAEPVGAWDEIAREAASRVVRGEESELLREYLTFRLGSASYAIPVERVREIVRLRGITPVPRVPKSVLGVVALRGEVVQVVDLRLLLGLESIETSRATRIIVLHGDDEKVTGVLVDGVQEVLRVAEDSIVSAPTAEGVGVGELCSRDGEFVSIVELDRVLELDANA